MRDVAARRGFLRSPGRTLGVLALGALLPASPARGSSRPALSVPATVTAADSLASAPATSARLAAFRAWMRSATLEQLMYVLRRPPGSLGDLERPAVQAALDRTPADRASLRERLAARLAASGGGRAHRGSRPPADSPANPSAFRVALILPTRGEDAPDAEAIALGFVAGLETKRAPGRPPIGCVRIGARGGQPADVAAALDSAAGVAAVACGAVNGTSNLVLAAGSRWRRIPVVIPGAAEPSRLSARAWAIGPTGEQRGRALANAVGPRPGDRVALFVSSAADTSFASGFAEACRARGAALVSRLVYAAGNQSFGADVHSLLVQRATLLFWDGDPPEAAALLRQLTRERVSLRVCGGDGFSPERHHRETRVFLEGVTFASADWVLGSEPEARLEARLGSASGEPASPLHVRGFLAGRLVAASLDGGALTPEEASAALARLAAAGDPGGAPLDAASQGAELPVYSIAAGKAKRAQ